MDRIYGREFIPFDLYPVKQPNDPLCVRCGITAAGMKAQEKERKKERLRKEREKQREKEAAIRENAKKRI